MLSGKIARQLFKKYYYLLIVILLTIGSLFSYQKTSSPQIYVSPHGKDWFPGSISKPLKSISRALAKAKPGNTIIIKPGIYREGITISNSVNDKSITIKAENKNTKEKVEILGSETSKSMEWKSCSRQTCKSLPAETVPHVYYTNLNWLEIPNLVYEIINSNPQKLILARSPNFKVETDWKYHENWWSPDVENNNQAILRDNKLKTLGKLNDGRLIMMDGADRCGIFLYFMDIKNSQPLKGEIIFDSAVGFSIFGSKEKAISKNTKYFVEGKIQLLDSPGEWYFDRESKIFYIWPLQEKNPAELEIEIARRSIGFDLSESSNINLDGLSITYINEDRSISYQTRGAIVINPQANNYVKNISIKNTTISHSAHGISLLGLSEDSVIENIQINNINIKDIARSAITSVASPVYPSNIKDISITDSDITHTSFDYNDSALNFIRVSNLLVKNNNISNHALYGLHTTSYEKNKGVSRNITIENNKIAYVCKNASSCSSIKIYGGEYQNTVIIKNFAHDNRGWSYCQEKEGSRGFAHGYFISNANGITFKNNITYNNFNGSGFSVYPRQLLAKDNQFLNNLVANSYIGIDLSNPGGSFDYDNVAYSTRHDNTIIKNNIFLKNYIGINADPANPEKLQIDYNAYIDNKINFVSKNKQLINLSSMLEQNPSWDTHSLETDNKTLKDVKKYNFNLSKSSVLRGRGDSGNDIGPCPFNLLSDTCPVEILNFTDNSD